MIETHLGLPNTCSRCGRPAGPTWWADTVDAARAGQGLCADCAGAVPKKRAPDAVSAEEAALMEAERAAAEAGMSADIPESPAPRTPGRRRTAKE